MTPEIFSYSSPLGFVDVKWLITCFEVLVRLPVLMTFDSQDVNLRINSGLKFLSQFQFLLAVQGLVMVQNSKSSLSLFSREWLQKQTILYN